MAFVMESPLVFRFVRAYLPACRRRRRRTGYPEGGAVPPDDDGRPTGGRGPVAAAAVSSAGTAAACVRVSAPRECVHVRASTLQL